MVNPFFLIPTIVKFIYSRRKKKEAVRPRVRVRRKRSDPATTTARLRNADQQRECAPREEEGRRKNIALSGF
ncbi:hypothetical protein [Okeania sp. KiyG1]|uniref:hypothetical protein n=1 Tax=Okeania sp. KiyG1 TaxID=2720165 RepID=UPI001923BB52|nr:hypothetical protein [Okeania sp. KiyG1]